ncbi:hypothetical protein [Marinobacterium stanieri]|uniref:hypothetical protein n=1 Tax=Marinobacterium stanieri TaxID=49186 RepID=UPI003A8FFEDA
MDLTLLLPGAPSQRPNGYVRCSELQLTDDIQADDLEQLALPALKDQIKNIIAGMNSDRALLQKAQTTWPQANLLWHQNGENWSRQIEPTIFQPASPDQPSGNTVPVIPVSEQNSSDTSKIVRDYFLRHAWGANKHQRDIEAIEVKAERLLGRVPDLDRQLRQARQSGELASELTGQLQAKLRQLGDSEAFSRWFETTLGENEGRVGKHLKKVLEKSRENATKQRAKFHANRNHKITTTALQLKPEGHPNALTNQSVRSSWNILIDETGQHFDEQVESLGPNNKDVGKVVALALPETTELPPLKPGFHAYDESDARIEQILRDLTSQPVGIFGFSSQDRMAGRFSWLQQIDLLVRWVLRLLPLSSSSPTRVNFMIEERGGFNTSVDWKIRTETILAELHQLNPERYGQLRLDIRFIGKSDSPFNGYVDTLANAWGSAQKSKKALLQHFKLLEHCLLHSDDTGIYERLLLTLEGNRPLRPADWYQLLQASGADNEQMFTLLGSCLHQLGVRVQQQSSLWDAYLSEVQIQLRQKTYSPASLQRTIDWLERYKPEQSRLPGLLQLRYKAACLAVDNHRGLCDLNKVADAVGLANELIDEDARQACEIMLRAVVAATNNFDFSSLEPFIQEWLQKPVATVGLVNHGKLLSTQGQLQAFRGETEGAVASFEQAIEVFSQLSDPRQAKREIAQSASYQLFAQLKSRSCPDNLLTEKIDQHLARTLSCPSADIPLTLACSGDAHRYLHHLFVRTLITFPTAMQSACKRYLEAYSQWQEGDAHPWPLILGYRAWLLIDAGQAASASDCLQQAIAICEETPESTLQWIGCVLQALGKKLGIETLYCEPLDQKLRTLSQIPTVFPYSQLAQLREGSSLRENLLHGLDSCLPFNFH